MNDRHTVFIGHGRSSAWRELKEFMVERLGLAVDEFNRISVAGIPTANRLSEMLDTASFAFLIMTAEDEQADRKLHARLNVIHEAGLFQGRLGFNKAVLLLEKGCEEFSNIHGLGQIRFVKDNIRAIFEDIRAFLDREQAPQQPEQPSQQPYIETIHVQISAPGPNTTLKYPLKCYVTLRNKSRECLDVSLASYEQDAVTLKDFPIDVLQLRFRGEWCPRPDGVERISVLPDQSFRAWVGPDDRKFSADRLNEMRGRIGTLVFSMSGKPFSVKL
jgi:hypothetical protein